MGLAAHVRRALLYLAVLAANTGLFYRIVTIPSFGFTLRSGWMLQPPARAAKWVKWSNSLSQNSFASSHDIIYLNNMEKTGRMSFW